MKEIQLTQGYVARIDDADFDRVAALTWHANKQNDGTVYAGHSFGAKYKPSKVSMHRFILGVTDPKVEVDHWDGDGLNNQRRNLRTCTHQQNCNNQKKRKNGLSSKFRGVCWNARDERWQVRIGATRDTVGNFMSEEEAGRAYDLEGLRRFGAFARLNFPVAQ